MEIIPKRPKRGNVERAFANPTTNEAPLADERPVRNEGSPRASGASTGEVNDRGAGGADDDARLEDATEDRE